MSIPAGWLIHAITVEPYLGQTGGGAPSYGPPVTVPCFVEQKVRRIRASSSDTSSGDEVLSEATAYADPTEAHFAACQVESRVTLPRGRTTKILQTLDRDAGDLHPWSHLEIVLA